MQYLQLNSKLCNTAKWFCQGTRTSSLKTVSRSYLTNEASVRTKKIIIIFQRVTRRNHFIKLNEATKSGKIAKK